MPKKFATAINCMDGRAQKPVIEYVMANFGVDYVDMITEPGPNRILAEGKDTYLVESIKKRVEISVKKHGSKVIVIAAHHDCAGNPVDENAQKQHLEKAVETVTSWGLPVEKITSLWLDERMF